MTSYKNRYKFTVEMWVLADTDLEALAALQNWLEAGSMSEFRSAGYGYNFMEQMNHGAIMPERVINMRPLLEQLEGLEDED